MSDKLETASVKEPGQMDVGLYLNFFQVNFDDDVTEFMLAPRSLFPDLRTLRQQLTDLNLVIAVFSSGEQIYGYGDDKAQLVERGFRPTTLRIATLPPLASRLILDGYIRSLEQAGYSCQWRFARVVAYQYNRALVETAEGVKLFRGFELQSMFLRDPETRDMVYRYRYRLIIHIS